MTNKRAGAHPMIPRAIRLFSVPILLFWLGLTVLVNVAAPRLETVGQEPSVSLAPNDVPSMQAMKRFGRDFQEFNSNSSDLSDAVGMEQSAVSHQLRLLRNLGLVVGVRRP
jgi:RND superfamily putative drug exporter